MPEELVKVPPQELVLATMYEEDAGAGFENVTAADKQTPFLMVCQTGSPQVARNEAKYIRGISVGDVFNSVTGEFFGSTEATPSRVEVVPCGFFKKIVEWKPDRGGFVVNHDVMPPFDLNEKKQRVVKGGINLLVDTAYHIVLYKRVDGTWAPAVISMVSTQLKKSRGWITVQDAIRFQKADGTQYKPPMFAHRYSFSTALEGNELGKWYGWKIEIAGKVEEQNLYVESKALANSVREGKVTMTPPPVEGAGEEKDTEIPF